MHADRIRLYETIESLDPDDRTMLMLRFHEDQPYAQIARVVGRPEGTVKYRILLYILVPVPFGVGIRRKLAELDAKPRP